MYSTQLKKKQPTTELHVTLRWLRLPCLPNARSRQLTAETVCFQMHLQGLFFIATINSLNCSAPSWARPGWTDGIHLNKASGDRTSPPSNMAPSGFKTSRKHEIQIFHLWHGTCPMQHPPMQQPLQPARNGAVETPAHGKCSSGLFRVSALK